MSRQRVASSNIHAIGYNEEDSTLEVEFSGGGIYKYFDVPKDVYEALLTAKSVGKKFLETIKGSYEFERI